MGRVRRERISPLSFPFWEDSWDDISFSFISFVLFSFVKFVLSFVWRPMGQGNRGALLGPAILIWDRIRICKMPAAAMAYDSIRGALARGA